jgi:RNase P subunit RPR2
MKPFRVKCRKCGHVWTPDTARQRLLESKEQVGKPIVVRCPMCNELNRVRRS